MTQLVAILDPPDPRSLGVVPLVTRTNGELSVHGLHPDSEWRARSLERNGLERLVAAGHAVQLNERASTPVGPEHAAMWVGHDFLKDNPVFPTPVKQRYQVQNGELYVLPASDAHLLLQHWTRLAFERFRDADAAERREIALSMRWVLPLDPRTRAAVYSSSAHEELELQRQCAMGLSTSTKQLRAQLTAVLEQAPAPISLIERAFVAVGGSGTNREEVARIVAKEAGLTWASFEARVREEAGADAPKHDLMEAGQRLVDTGLVRMVHDVLSGAVAAGTRVMIDSLRHGEVLNMLSWMTGGHTVVIGVQADLEATRRRIEEKARRQQSRTDADEVLQHPTETQIPALLEKADHKVDTSEEYHGRVSELVQMVGA